MGTVPNPTPPGIITLSPEAPQADSQPLFQHCIGFLKLLQADGDDIVLVARLLHGEGKKEGRRRRKKREKEEAEEEEVEEERGESSKKQRKKLILVQRTSFHKSPTRPSLIPKLLCHVEVSLGMSLYKT